MTALIFTLGNILCAYFSPVKPNQMIVGSL